MSEIKALWRISYDQLNFFIKVSPQTRQIHTLSFLHSSDGTTATPTQKYDEIISETGPHILNINKSRVKVLNLENIAKLGEVLGYLLISSLLPNPPTIHHRLPPGATKSK